MTRREKILFVLVGIAVLGAGLKYAYKSFAQPDDLVRKSRADQKKLMTTVQASLKQGNYTGRERRVVEAAISPWARDPLLKNQLSLNETSSKSQSPLPKYFGYINTGSKIIAIIDGVDYQSGEFIPGGVFQVLQIYPDHLEILRRGASDPIDILLEKPEINKPSQ